MSEGNVDEVADGEGIRVIKMVYSTVEDAEDAVETLLAEGVPVEAVSVEEEPDPVVEGPLIGVGIGSGVPPDALEALLTEHDGEGVRSGSVSLYAVRVEIGDDPEIFEMASRVLGYQA